MINLSMDSNLCCELTIKKKLIFLFVRHNRNNFLIENFYIKLIIIKDNISEKVLYKMQVLKVSLASH